MNSASPIRGSYLHDRNRMRLMVAMVISILFHALLLSLQFGIPGLGLPGLTFPWNERRAREAELSVRLSNPKAAPEAPAQSAADKPSIDTQAAEPAATPDPPQPPKPRRKKPSSETPAVSDRMEARPLPQAPSSPPPVVDAEPAPAIVKQAPEAVTPPTPAPQPTQSESEPPIIAHRDERESDFVVPPEVSKDDEQQAAAPVETLSPPLETPEVAKPPEEVTIDSRDEEQDYATALEAARKAEEVAREAEKQLKDEESAQRATDMAARKQEEENAQRQAMELEAQRRAEDAARQQADALAIEKEQQAAQQREQEEDVRRAQQLEAKAQDEKRQQLEREEREAIALEARRKAEEAAREAAALARQKQAEELVATERAQELAARQKAEAAMAEQRERDRVISDNAPTTAAAPSEGTRRAEPPSLPRNLSGGELTSRAIQQARQLDAPRSEPQVVLRPAARTDSPRRRTILGSEQDIGLRMYVESWRLKIERNGSLNYTQSSKEKARGDPVATVVIRSDGSVEGVYINRSSGLPELDESVRRIVQINARYSAFPPELARRYDEIEIRRIWNFDDRLTILEEVR
jgi:hypothetical protein